MNRQEFLFQLWRRFVKPGLSFAVLVVCIRFLMAIFTQNGVERQLAYFSIGLAVFLGVLIVFRLGADLLSDWIWSGISTLPIRIQHIIKFISAALGYLGLFGLLALSYFLWTEENYIELILPVFYLIIHLNILLRKLKQD